MRLVFLAFFILSGSRLFSQEDSTKYTKYWSVEANQLIRQVFSLSNSSLTNNPYLITYSRNKSNGKGFAFGLGYSIANLNTERNSFDGKNKSQSFDFRVGTDRKIILSEKLKLATGFDFIFSRRTLFTKSRTDFGNNASTTVESKEKASEFGFGPRGGLLYRIHPRVSISTEFTTYMTFISGKNELVTTDVFPSFDPFTGQQSSSVNRSEDTSKTNGYNLSFNVPTAIFITIQFAK